MVKRGLVFVVLVALMLSCAKDVPALDSGQMEIQSSRYTQPDPPCHQVLPFLDTDGFDLVTQSDAAQLWLNQEMHTIRLIDVRSGYVWGAIPLTDARKLNTSWKSYAASIVSIECFDSKYNEKRYGLHGNAQVQYHFQKDGFSFDVDFQKLGIRFSGSYRLNSNVLNCQIKPDSFEEDGDYQLKSLTFSPFLGSVFEDEVPGWFLLPDGPGALMRFRKGGSYVSGFDKRIYGKDFALDIIDETQSLGANRPNDYLMPENQVNIPVFGIVHGVGQHGMLVEVEKGETCASIVATPAGLGNTSYNSAMVRFEYRQKYSKATTRSGSGALVPQKEPNAITPQQSYHLLTGKSADYDKMAVYFREILILDGRLKAREDRVSLKLEVLGTDVRKNAMRKSWQVFSRISDVYLMAEALEAAGVNSLDVVLRQFNHRNLAGEGMSSALGSRKELAALAVSFKEQGNKLLIHLDPVRANIDQISLRLHAANTMGKTPITINRHNPLLVYPTSYLLRPEEVSKRVQRHLLHYPDMPIALDQLGQCFYGDYTTGKEMGRIQAQENCLYLISVLSEKQNLGLYNPILPAWRHASAYYNVPIVNGQYLFENDTVPFLPILLKGSLPMFIAPLNANSFTRERLLRMLEYGINPSFTVTQAPSETLAYTPLEDYFSTNFNDWHTHIVAAWQEISPALKEVAGARILSHQVSKPGLVEVAYDNGVLILVNYTHEPWIFQQTLVHPMSSAMVKED